MNTNLYGVIDEYGLNWNIPVEETEIIIEVNELYYMLKSSLMKY
jgi:hypothetical protein